MICDDVVFAFSLTSASQRGNLNTRLHKLDSRNDYDCIILAKAGLDRMNWQDRISSVSLHVMSVTERTGPYLQRKSACDVTERTGPYLERKSVCDVIERTGPHL